MAVKVKIPIGNVSPNWRTGVPLRDLNALLVKDSLGNQVFTTLDANYTCVIFANNGANTVDRDVTEISEDGFRFLAQLTSAETLLLGVGQITVAIEVENTTLSPPFLIEQHEPLELIAQLAS